jgi:hypothetical protein
MERNFAALLYHRDTLAPIPAPVQDEQTTGDPR